MIKEIITTYLCFEQLVIRGFPSDLSNFFHQKATKDNSRIIVESGRNVAVANPSRIMLAG